jgi:hypothetical protein
MKNDKDSNICLLLFNSYSYFYVQVDMGDEEKVKEAIDRVR